VRASDRTRYTAATRRSKESSSAPVTLGAAGQRTKTTRAASFREASAARLHHASEHANAPSAVGRGVARVLHEARPPGDCLALTSPDGAAPGRIRTCAQPPAGGKVSSRRPQCWTLLTIRPYGGPRKHACYLEQVLSRAFGRDVAFVAAQPEQRTSGVAEEFWPDREGLHHRDTLTDFEMPAGTFSTSPSCTC
jgi:hypothetical protein